MVDTNLLLSFAIAALVGGGIAYLAQRRVNQQGGDMSLPSYSAWMEMLNKIAEQERQLNELQKHPTADVQAKLDYLLTENAKLRQQVTRLETEVTTLQDQMQALRQERDDWKRAATKVP